MDNKLCFDDLGKNSVSGNYQGRLKMINVITSFVISSGHFNQAVSADQACI